MPSNPTNQDSLYQFFGAGEHGGLKKGLAEFLTSDDYGGARDELRNQLSSIKWPSAVDKIVAHIDLLLDTPVSTALEKIYAEANILNRYLDRDKYDPEEVVLVELAEHNVTSTYEPHLDIVINDQRVASLKLDITLELELKGLILKIQDAKIKDVIPGSCRGTGKISFYGKVLAAKESKPVELPILNFGAGLAIAP